VATGEGGGEFVAVEDGDVCRFCESLEGTNSLSIISVYCLGGVWRSAYFRRTSPSADNNCRALCRLNK
jgi:hypothetical protein